MVPAELVVQGVIVPAVEGKIAAETETSGRFSHGKYLLYSSSLLCKDCFFQTRVRVSLLIHCVMFWLGSVWCFRYLALLSDYPVLTKSVTSALLTLIGDLICQVVCLFDSHFQAWVLNVHI